MGGAVSSGRDNNELVDNLLSGNYIRSLCVERVFRVLDRADYMSPESRDQAYKDLAWRSGPFHLSAPCIYSEVMEALELKPGLSFLNIGSGTGYLSTLVGLIIGSSGISHGVEAHAVVTEYANKKLSLFIENSATLDEFDFCMPKYYTGNGLCLAPLQSYDRVYCGAGVLTKHECYFKHLIKVGGVLVMPLADTLVQIRRVAERHWTVSSLLNVSFAFLREPAKQERDDLIKLEEQCPASLAVLSRAVIRRAIRDTACKRDVALQEPARRRPTARPLPRRICIPIDADSDEELNELHDLDEEGGAHEMNALLSLVLSMGQNRVAGSLRLEHNDDDYDDLHDDDDDVPPPDDDAGVILVDVAGLRSLRRRSPPAPGPSRPSDRPNTRSRTRQWNRDNGPLTRSKTRQSHGDISILNAARKSGSSRSCQEECDTDKGTTSNTSTESEASPPEPLDRHSDEETQTKESKRQKLDSGIGDGTASGASRAPSSTSRSDHTYEYDSDMVDMGWDDMDAFHSCSSTDDDDDAADSDDDGTNLKRSNLRAERRCRARSEGSGKKAVEGRRRIRARRRGRKDGREGSSPARTEDGPRRARLAAAVQHAVAQLPLPQPLRQYVNLGRAFRL